MVVDTISPSSVEQVTAKQADPDRFGFPGSVDLNLVDDWRTVSSFIHPNAADVNFDKGDPSVSFGAGKVFRVEESERYIYYVGSTGNLSLADNSKNYVYFDENQDYVSKKVDEPEHRYWLLAAVIDTNTGKNTVRTLTRGRRPIPEIFVGDLDEDTVAGSKTGEHVDFQDVEQTIPSGASNTEVARFLVQSDERFYAKRFGLAITGGGTPDVTARLYDVTSGYEIVTVSAGSLKVGDPLSTSDAGSTMALEVTNNSGSDQEATIQGHVPVITDDANITTDVIEDWERPNPIGDYNGDTGNASLVQSNVQHRDNAMELGSTDFIWSPDGGGLPKYPDQGDTFEYWQIPPSGGVAEFYFAVQDSSNYYRVDMDEANGEVELWVISGGTGTQLDSFSANFDATGYSNITIEWTTSDEITVAMTENQNGSDQGRVTVTDSTYTDGGIGWGEA